MKFLRLLLATLVLAVAPAMAGDKVQVNHKYWDEWRKVSIPMTLTVGAIDGYTTSELLSSGRFHEGNPLAWNVGNGGPRTWVAVTGSYLVFDLSTSYLLHLLGHHKIERWFTFSLIVGGSAAGLSNARKLRTLRRHGTL